MLDKTFWSCVVLVLAALFLGEKVTVKTAAAGVLVFLGVLLLSLK